MNNYVIFTDATADLPASILTKINVGVIPMDFEVSGKSYTHYSDSRELASSDFFQKMKDGATATTSQINVTRYIEYFSPILEQGTDILYIGFSSGLSGTYQASMLAMNELKEKFPERTIISIDSLAASGGEGLLVYLASIKKEEGLTIHELADWVTDNRNHICHWFTVDDLHHLKRGGRISAVSATFGTALDIKPILHVDQEGKLSVHSKVRGRKKCEGKLLEQLKNTAIDPETTPMVITHGNCFDEAQNLANKIKELYGTKDIIISDMGPIIGSHTGSGVLVLSFYGTEK